MHVNTYIVFEIFFVVWKYDVIIFIYIYIGETRPYFKTKHFLNMYFVRFDANRVFLILGLYPCGIKIQPNINLLW
jgi:hypothetical protein